MRQTWAIFVDAYRELNSKKLFWISLTISLVVVITLALPTQTERGFSIFGAKLETGPFQLLGSNAISASAFYKFIYSWFGINLWLGWGATILALITTASMIPDLVSSGSIELTLAKPIRRLRLFLTKYAAGLVFVGLQAAVFAIGAILVIGLRSGVWDVRPLLIIPIMVLFFSFLHCISVLTGLLTRSTLMSLLAVLIMWMFFWALASVETVFLGQVTGTEREVTRITEQQKVFKNARDVIDGQIKAATPAGPSASAQAEDVADTAAQPELSPPQPETAGPPQGRRSANQSTRRVLRAGERMQQMLSAATDSDLNSLKVRRESVEAQIRSLDKELTVQQDSLTTSRRWHWWLHLTYTVFPKTGETKDLFQRWVIDKSDWDGFLKMLDEFSDGNGRSDPQEALNQRPLWWIIGTSLGFEAVILGIACWIFCRRDF